MADESWLDVYESAGTATAVVVLLHGSGPNEREVMAPLASELAELDATVLAPDWDATDHDLSRRLTAVAGQAVRFARALRIHQVIVAGWSAGGSAAFWLSSAHPVTFSRLALIATSLTPLPTLPVASTDAVDTVFVTGSSDDIVPAADSLGAITRLRSCGYRVRHVIVDADHAGVIRTEYDETQRRCRPSSDPAVLEAGSITAQAILRH